MRRRKIKVQEGPAFAINRQPTTGFGNAIRIRPDVVAAAEKQKYERGLAVAINRQPRWGLGKAILRKAKAAKRQNHKGARSWGALTF
jgi:hypothetical protein